MPHGSPFLKMTRGWEIKDKEALAKIVADSCVPLAVAWRAKFLHDYGKMPFGERAADELFASMMREARGKVRST
jgi:hypothetical protein